MKKWLKLTSFSILTVSLSLSTIACTTKERITSVTSNQDKDPHSKDKDNKDNKDNNKCENECYFCKMLNKQSKSHKVYENDYVYAFLKENPATNGHTVVVPKKHFKSLADCDAVYLVEIWRACKLIAEKIHKSIKAIGINYLSKDGKALDQTISHFYQEVIPKYVNGEWYIRNVNVSSNTWVCDLKQVAKMINSKNL